MKHLGPLSCVLSLLGIAGFFVLNTMLVPWMAGAAVVVGIAGLLLRKRVASSVGTILAVVGTAVGGLTLAFWACVVFLVWSAATGNPM